MAVKTYGEIILDPDKNQFVITKAEPHVCIKLKHIFPKIKFTAVVPFYFANTPDNCADLNWFLQRYPLSVEPAVKKKIKKGTDTYIEFINILESITMPEYQPAQIMIREGEAARRYQLTGSEVHMKVKRLLLGDDIGLGKTLTAILSFMNPKTLPGIAVVQTHMPKQWKVEAIERFTTLTVHIINGTRPYDLPKADVYIIRYSCLAGWVNIFTTGFFKSALFDECQELRIETSQKYNAAKKLSETVEWCMGLTATPVYNFGDEMYNVLDCINPGCLGQRSEFLREWASQYSRHHKINDPKALGSYLRERFLFLRRTRAEVGRELPLINKLVHTIGYDQEMVSEHEELAKTLATRILTGSFTERGQASYELDMLARHITGVSKARGVAEYVKILMENDEPTLLAGWHRDVYDIWLKELAEYNPVMYTGSESPTQKDNAKKDFIEGKTNLMIISLRSGAGLDGLQKRCHNVVLGELDWSPEVHDQLIGRANRDGQEEQVTAHYLVSDYGSDPVVINLLGLKASQSHGIINPELEPGQQYSDASRMKMLAQYYLDKKEKQTSLF